MPLTPDLEAKNLIIFYHVAIEKSLTAAAEKMHLTQPAVSYHIRNLEAYSGVKLLEFKKQQAVLTSAGEKIFRYAGEIYKQLVNAERYIQFIKEPTLKVGIANIYSDILNPVMTDMLDKEEAKVKMSVKSGNSYELIRQVSEAELDVVIVPQLNINNADLHRVIVSFPEKMVCFASPLQAISGEPLEWEDLLGYNIIAGPDKTAIRQLVVGELAGEQVEERLVSTEVDDVDWYIRLIESGKGIGFILLKSIEKQLKRGTLKVIELKKDVYIIAESISRSDIVPNLIIDRFISLVKREFGYID